MPKIIINSYVKSSDDEEILTNKKAILKDEIITYINNNISVSVNIKNDLVILKRENEKMKITLEFKKNKKTNSFYDIKNLNIRMKVTVETKELVINSNSLSIKYDLYLNGEFSDSFDYNLEWRDL